MLGVQLCDTCSLLVLQSVQAAVDHQLTTLARASPSQKVAIITFSDEVSKYMYVHVHARIHM